VKFLILSLLFIPLCSLANISIVINTNDSGPGSLRTAIINAANGDTIKFDSSLIASGSDSIVLNSNIYFTKSLTIVGLYNSTDSLYISGSNSIQIFYIQNTTNVVLDSLIFIHGKSANGGAIRFRDSDTLFLKNSYFLWNESTTNGGAVNATESNFSTTVVVTNCEFIGNSSNSRGGAIYVEGPTFNPGSANLLVEDSKFFQNATGIWGGAIAVREFYSGTTNPHLAFSRIEMNNCIIENNESAYGGGVCALGYYNSKIYINGSIISNNLAYAKGGGVYIEGYTTSDLQVLNSTLSQNIADIDGGGLCSYSGANFCDTSWVYIENSVLTDNSAALKGGGVACFQTLSLEGVVIVDINDSEIINNSAGIDGGGIFSQSFHLSLVQVDNSTISNNSAIENGGGINSSGIYASSSLSEIDISSSTIDNNTAAKGAGVYSFSGSYNYLSNSYTIVNIDKSTLTQNIASNIGGGICSDAISTSSSSVNLTNTTLYNNKALNQGGGIYSSSFSFNSSISVTSSILALNGQYNIYNDQNPAILSGGYNVFSDLTLNGSISTDQLNADSTSLSLGLLSNNGGTTQTLLPGPYSIVLDNGNPVDFSDAQNGPIIDIRDAGAAESLCTANYGADTISACNNYTWIDGITYVSSTNTPTDTLTNVSGCDSIVTLVLTMYQNDSTSDAIIACDTYTWIDGITYTSSTNTPTFTYSNQFGCDSVIGLNLTVHHSTNGTDVISACQSYTWIDGNTYTLSNNTANFVLTNQFGCDSIVNLDLIIINTDAAVTQNGAVLTADQGGAGYQWITCSGVVMVGQIAQSLNAPSPGDYAVIVNFSGCIDTSACIEVLDYTEVQESTLSSGILIYPNPTSGQVTLQFQNSVKREVSLYDMLGQELLKNIEVLDNTFLFSISELPAGIYLLKITEDGEDQIFKLIRN